MAFCLFTTSTVLRSGTLAEAANGLLPYWRALPFPTPDPASKGIIVHCD
mgnify:CR=1 FL=1